MRQYRASRKLGPEGAGVYSRQQRMESKDRLSRARGSDKPGLRKQSSTKPGAHVGGKPT